MNGVPMAFDYLPVDRDQGFLLPPDIRDWLPEGHLAWFVLDVVARLDTSGLHARHPNAGVGRRAYDPEVLFALLVYAYCCGVRSSRRVEALCEVDVAYRVIAANQSPDHTTIARFRQAHEAGARRLFVQVLELCERTGMVKLGVVAVDGTKMAASASAKANRTRREVQAEVDEIFAQAEATDAAEDRRFGDARGDELPAGLRERAGRAALLEAALAELGARQATSPSSPSGVAAPARDKTDLARDKRDLARADRASAKAEAELAGLEVALASPRSKLALAEANLAEAVRVAAEVEARRNNRGGPRKTPQGRNVARRRTTRDRQVALAQRRHAHALARAEKARARAAQVRARQAERLAYAEAAGRARAGRTAQHAEEARVNLTDPASRLLKSPRGWVQGYNAQAAVASGGVIIAAAVTHEHSDTANCVPMMAAVQANLEAVGAKDKVGTMLFDAGYLSQDNIMAPGPPRLIATAKSFKLRRAAKDKGYRQGSPPAGASPIEAMEHRLLTEEGANLYAMRQHVVEPVFGHTKHNRGFTRFMRRGQSAADAEWDLITATHNLVKLHRHLRLAHLATT